MVARPLINLLVWGFALLHILYAWLAACYRARRAQRRKTSQFELVATPLVSVLIPAWNESSVLEKTLQAVQSSTYPKWETIIIAGGLDGTEALARNLCAKWRNCHVLPQLPQGKNAALNQGFRHARGSYLVLLDADTIVEPEWLTNLITPLTQGYFAATANYSPSTWTWISTYYEMQKVASYFVGNSTSLHGGGYAVRREVVERMGGFPEDVTVGVDWDFDQRVDRLGFLKVFVPQAHHHTPLAHSLGKYLFDEIRWRRAHLRAVFRFFNLNSAFALRFYLVALAFFIAPVILLWLFPSLSLLLCFYLWVLLRRLGLVIEVTMFSADVRWLRYVWIPPVMLVVDFLSALAAFFTLWKRQTFFKGPRPGVKENT